MGVGHIYYAMLLFVVLPSAAFSRVAMVILLTWLAGEYAMILGAQEPFVNLFQHAAGLTLALLLGRSVAGMLATVLFIPLVVADAMLLLELLSPVAAWWIVLTLACVQAAILPFANDWQRVRRTVRGYRHRRKIGRILRWATC